MMLTGAAKAAIGTNAALAETDFRSEIQQIRMPTLIIHGDQHGDQDTACPIDATGRKVAKAVPKSELKVYPGAKQ
jgi:non-heme chloroperoxidase